MLYFMHLLFGCRLSYRLVQLEDPNELKGYRYIQIVTNLCNEVTQKVIMPVGILGSVVVLGVSFAILINTISQSQDPSILVLMTIVCAETAFYLLFGLHGLAEVNHGSKHLLENATKKMTGISKRKSRKWFRQCIASCPPIKMKFGDNNYVDMLTPLKSMNQAVQISVQILLLGRI